VNAQLEQLRAAVSSRYVIERELGAGGMAKVYLAHDVKHDRDVAIKVLNPELSQSLGSDRFLSEIRTTARLQHPHILPLLDSDATDGLLYYVMPLVGGETLRARLAREKQLPIEDALLIAREVADALNHAHAHGVVHRDIKPENILLQDGHALVADFGIALALESAGGQRVTQTGISLGTPHYMSPEQGMGERAIDARTDIYSLGVVTYEMLTGQPPFTGATAQAILGKVLTEKPAPPSGVRDTVAPHVEHAVLKALAKLPADRWATASKFAEALTRTDLPHTSGERHAGIGFRDASTQVHGTHAASRRALVVGGLAAALLLPGAWWLGRRSNTPAAPWAAFTQLTDASGMETSPSLSPDGDSFVYASNTNGTWDIFVQRVGGRNPVLVGVFCKRHLWVHNISFVLVGRAKNQPVGGILPQLQHNVSRKQVRSVLLTPQYRHLQLIEDHMTSLMQEHIHQRSQYSIFLCQTARQSFLWRTFQNVCHVFVTDRHETFVEPGVRVTVATRKLEKQWTRESKRAQQSL